MTEHDIEITLARLTFQRIPIAIRWRREVGGRSAITGKLRPVSAGYDFTEWQQEKNVGLEGVT